MNAASKCTHVTTPVSNDMASFILDGGVGFCNAVRRSLISDTAMWAPCSLEVQSNTSCETDEYIAHRVGMIPFRRTGHGETLKLKAVGPAKVCAKDFVGTCFEPMHGAIVIMELGKEQELDVTVHFDKKRASSHVRYAPLSAVGMERVDRSRYRIAFEVLDDRTPTAALHEALDALEERVDRALQNIAHQPDPPPTSMC